MPSARDGFGDGNRWWVIPPPSPRLNPYLVAALLVGASVLASRALEAHAILPEAGLAMLPAVLAAAWYGGPGPGVVATALGIAALLSAGRAAVHPVPLLLFSGLGLGIAWLSHGLRSAAAAAASRAERLDAVINTTVDGIVVIDTEGRIEAFNRGAEQLFGYAAAEVLGRNVSLLMPSPFHDEHDGYIKRYLQGGDPHIIGKGREVTARRRDGTIFPVHLSVGEMRVGGQRTFTGMLHDLTERVELEGQLGTSEARWRAVIDSAVDGIVVIDAQGRIETFNPGAERLFGYQASEVLGHNINVLMPSPYREEHDGYLSRYLTTGEARIIGIGREVQGRRKDGSAFPVHLSVGQIAIGGERKFTGILHDLTSRIAMEQRLREQAALAGLGEMAAVIAHEVKNPLAGIRGALQVSGSRLAPDDKGAALLKEIIIRIDALDRMMKDLLLFARTPNPKPMAIDLKPLVGVTASLLAQDPALHELRVEIDGEAPPVMADADMLRIVFQNLLINGAHAMKGHGVLHVSIGVSDASCRVTFTDAGPGIPDDVRDKLFKPFFTTKARGSGLGLPTAKRLVEAQHGRIAIECPPSGGTVVVVELPLAVR